MKKTIIIVVSILAGAILTMCAIALLNFKKYGYLTFIAEGERASLRVSEMPVDNSVDNNDLLYVIDKGVSSRQMTMKKLIDSVGYMDNLVRGELADTAAQLRSEIGGEGFWTQVPAESKIYTTHYVGIGTTNPQETLDVNGRVRALDVESPTFTLTSDDAIEISYSGSNLIFKDYLNTSGVTLSDLVSGGSLFSKTSTTYYPTTTTDNWNLGGNTATPYKLRVTGDLSVTEDIDIGGMINIKDEGYIFTAAGELYFLDDEQTSAKSLSNLLTSQDSSWVSANVDTLHIGGGTLYGTDVLQWQLPNTNYNIAYHKVSGVTLPQLTLPGVLEISDMYTYNHVTTNMTSVQKGMIFQPNDIDSLYYYNGTSWEALNKPGGGGSGDGSYTEVTVSDSLIIEGAIKWENVDQKSGYAFLYRNDTTGIIHVDSSAVVEASWAVKMQLPDIIEFVNDTINSEFKWYFKNEGDDIEYTYGLNYGNELPSMTFQKLSAMIELNTRWIAEQSESHKALEKRIAALEKGTNKPSAFIIILALLFASCAGLLTYFIFCKRNYILYEKWKE